MLNFIIPVKSHFDVDNWPDIKSNLAKTIASINNQNDSNWFCYLVCNTGCPLPVLPNNKFQVIEVDFKPDERVKNNSLKIKYDAIREDKGKRVYEAVSRCEVDDHFMVVDYDDFVSEKLSGYVSLNQSAAGWYISKGYYYSGGKLLVKDNKFNTKCGTSNIIRVSFITQFFDSSGVLPLQIIKELLGSHVFIRKYMQSKSVPFGSLPFAGAVYNVGITNSTSGTMGIFDHFFTKKILLSRPDRWVRKIFCLRYLTKKTKLNFNI